MGDPQPPVFCIERLCKIYRTGEVEVQALRVVDVTAAEREFIVIRGRSGSGKSTFLDIIRGFDRASSGKPLFRDLDLNGA